MMYKPLKGNICVLLISNYHTEQIYKRQKKPHLFCQQRGFNNSSDGSTLRNNTCNCSVPHRLFVKSFENRKMMN